MREIKFEGAGRVGGGGAGSTQSDRMWYRLYSVVREEWDYVNRSNVCMHLWVSVPVNGKDGQVTQRSAETCKI
jgi:hypothetical protein